jgi:hypothetical protein
MAAAHGHPGSLAKDYGNCRGAGVTAKSSFDRTENVVDLHRIKWSPLADNGDAQFADGR